LENPISPLGINIGGISYWSTGHPFLNFFKTASPFIAQNAPGYYNGTKAYVWNTNEDLHLDEYGYPTMLSYSQCAATLLLRDINMTFPDDDFILLYDGNGNLSLGFDLTVTRERKGRIEFSTKFSKVRDNGVYVQLLYTDPNNYVKNIRVMRKRDEFIHERLVFNPAFVQKLKIFSTLRYMDFTGTNSFNITSWSERAQVDDLTYMIRGAPLEMIPILSKLTSTDIWICLPHLADDEYINNIADYLFKNTQAHVKIYIEYSNEVWNQLFSQGRYAVIKGKELGISQFEFYSLRSVQIFTIFEKYFPLERIIRILSTQTVSTYISEKILKYNNAYLHADALGVTGYFSCDLTNHAMAARVPIMSFDQMFAKCDASLPNEINYIKKQLAIAAKYNISIAYYEGGPSILEDQAIYDGSETAGATEKYLAMHRHPKMKTTYLNFLNAIKNISGFGKYPYMQFGFVGLPTKYGSWGIVEYIQQNELQAPKYMALSDFLTSEIGVLKIPGCMISEALNFEAKANTPGNCEFPVRTISNKSALNLSVQAVKINLEKGSLSGPLDLSVDVVDYNTTNQTGMVLRFGPAGTKFLKPMKICMVEQKVSQVKILFSSDEVEWAELTNITKVNNSVCGYLSHFTLVTTMKSDGAEWMSMLYIVLLLLI
jgi:hypothetical protein